MSEELRNIPFLEDYTIKPKSANKAGVVVFTDGLNDNIIPNQKQCEAYGYYYDVLTSTCRLFIRKPNIDTNFANISNTSKGKSNVTAGTSNNNFINGDSNTVGANSNNNLIIGDTNSVLSEVDNSIILGRKGEAVKSNTFVMGGNNPTDNVAERQYIKAMYGTQTTAGGTVDSYLNNITDNYLNVPNNTIWFFHAYTVAVRVAGTNTGNTGDYASFVERGVVINKQGTLSIQRERDEIKSSGTTTDWRVTANVNENNFRLTVRGETNVTVEWCITVEITQIKTGVDL